MSKVPLTESNIKVTTPSTHDSIKSKTASASPSKRHQSSTNRKPSSSSSPTIKNRAVALRTGNGGSGGCSSLMESKNTLNIDAKENDVAVEINITTGPNVQVLGAMIGSIFFLSIKERFDIKIAILD